MLAYKLDTSSCCIVKSCVTRPQQTHTWMSCLQVVQAAAAAVWGCATSSRTRHLLTEIGAVEALLSMLQKTLTMDPPASGAVAGASVGQDASSAPPQQSERDQLQVLRCWCTCCIEQHSKKLIAAAQLNLTSCIKDSFIRLPDDCDSCRCCCYQACIHPGCCAL